MSYQYEVFISYSRRRPVSEWVSTHFGQLLLEWLGEADLDYEPRIFVDSGIHTGNDWPLELQNALLRSRLLVPVWSGSYFRSQWCMAELRSMQARERLCELRTAQAPHGLILPVRFSSRVPSDLVEIQARDLSAYGYNAPAFAGTALYLELIDEVKALVREIVDRLDVVPEWNESWPVELPEIEPSFSLRLPRL